MSLPTAVCTVALHSSNYTLFESLAVKIVGRQCSVVIVCVYRPPGELTSAFISQLSDLFDQLSLLDCRFVVVGDFSVCSCNTDCDSTSQHQPTSAATSST